MRRWPGSLTDARRRWCRSDAEPGLGLAGCSGDDGDDREDPRPTARRAQRRRRPSPTPVAGRGRRGRRQAPEAPRAPASQRTSPRSSTAGWTLRTSAATTRAPSSATRSADSRRTPPRSPRRQRGLMSNRRSGTTSTASPPPGGWSGVDLLAPKGDAAGATAHVNLVIKMTGKVDRTDQVRGRRGADPVGERLADVRVRRRARRGEGLMRGTKQTGGGAGRSARASWPRSSRSRHWWCPTAASRRRTSRS